MNLNKTRSFSERSKTAGLAAGSALEGNVPAEDNTEGPAAAALSAVSETVGDPLPAADPVPGFDAKNNVVWVELGAPEPWRQRFRWDVLRRAARILFTPEGWYRVAEFLAAQTEVNWQTTQSEDRPYADVTLHHRVTRSYIEFAGHGNLNLRSYRHLRTDGVLTLNNCSDEFDANPFAPDYASRVDTQGLSTSLPCNHR